MSRRYGKTTGRTWDRPDRYALVPLDVLLSEAFRTLPNYALRVLLAVAGQFNGRNNGDLSLTAAEARRFGVASTWQLYAGLDELQRHGLLIKTRQGGKRPMGCTLYALGWVRIHESDKYDVGVGATIKPVNGWARWSPPKQNDATPAGSVTLPPEVQRSPVTLPPEEQNVSDNATPGGRPSISRGGGGGGGPSREVRRGGGAA